MGDFERDTDVTGGDGHYRADLSKDWEIWGPNGGYLAAIALRAAGREAKIPRPVSFYVQFLSVARFAPVELEVTPIRVGRRAEAFRVSMTQEGRPVIEAMLRTAAEGPGLGFDALACPDVPAPEALDDMATARAKKGLPESSYYAFWGNFEVRATNPDFVGPPAGPGEPAVTEWLRFTPRATFDDPWVDAGRSVVLVDTFSWPAAHRGDPDSGMIAPSLDCVVWFHRAAPTAEWLLADQNAPTAGGGLIGTHGRVWSPAGELLASGGSQLYCMPAPKES